MFYNKLEAVNELKANAQLYEFYAEMALEVENFFKYCDLAVSVKAHLNKELV